MWESSYSKEQISGVGVGIGALVDSDAGIVRYRPDFEWVDVNFRDILRKRIHHSVFIENDVNSLAILEHWFGEDNLSDNFIVVALQHGVGAGCVVNGQLMRGHFGLAGEFGHMLMDPGGPLCGCGMRGCLGAYAGANGILRQAKSIADKGTWKTERKGNITFDDVLRELEKGNPELEKVYTKAGEVLGIGISYLIKLFDPERVIITGEGVRAGDHLLRPMHESLNKRLSKKLARYRPDIVLKQWTDEAWARGAGTLVLQEIYKSPAIK